MTTSFPIGIFDSGVGGLTVAHAITQLLPNENIIYFGDTAHLPWGNKSAQVVQNYSVKICDFLLQKQCKAIVVACNTASALALEEVKKRVDGRAEVINVIDPMVAYLGKHYSQKRIGLIGTKQTVRSNIYTQKIEALDCNIQLRSVETPLLVSLIEEGFANKKLTQDALSEYLSHPSLHGQSALVLACTHYPLIKRHIENFYENRVKVIDSSEIVAEALKALLTKKNLHNEKNHASQEFYVSDFTDVFAETASLFFKNKLSLIQQSL